MLGVQAQWRGVASLLLPHPGNGREATSGAVRARAGAGEFPSSSGCARGGLLRLGSAGWLARWDSLCVAGSGRRAGGPWLGRGPRGRPALSRVSVSRGARFHPLPSAGSPVWRAGPHAVSRVAGKRPCWAVPAVPVAGCRCLPSLTERPPYSWVEAGTAGGGWLACGHRRTGPRRRGSWLAG